MKKFKEFLKEIFSPRVTYYVNSEKVDKLPKWAKDMNKSMRKSMNDMFDQFDKF
jgi:hypothetical protein